MNSPPRAPIDCNGVEVRVGSRVRVLGLSGDWYDKLPTEERPLVDSMIGEVFEVEEIDAYGQPWVCKRWPDEAAGTCVSHSVALEPAEMLCIDTAEGQGADGRQNTIDLETAKQDFKRVSEMLEGLNGGPDRA